MSKGDLQVGALAAAVALTVFAIDLALPLGVAAGVPYVAAVLVGWWLSRARTVFLLAGAASLLVIAGYYLSPPGGTPWVVLVNRTFAIFAIWIMAALVVKAKSAERKLRDAQANLERRVEARTAALGREVEERRQIEQDLRRSKERLAEILDIAGDAVVSTDGAGIITLFNKGAEDIFGYSAAEALGRPIEMLIPGRFRKDHRQYSQSFAGATRRSRLMGERAQIFGLRKDGSEFPARASISKAQTGSETILTAVVHDVSDLKKAEDALRANERALERRVADLEEARDRLEKQGADLVLLAEELRGARTAADAANNAKSEFLASMSHELRTPLNAVIGFSELMLAETMGPLGNPQYVEYLQDIHDSGQHLLALINDVLDLSKVESGSDELHEEAIEIAELLQSSMKLVQQRAAKRGVALEPRLDGPLPLLYADKRKMKQMLVNLLTNAVKFTEAGGSVTLAARRGASGELIFQVSDTGVGIAEEDLPNVMSRFGQAGHVAGREQEGTGLGLPLTKALVEQHGGSFALESALGVGTSVTLTFPPARSLPQGAASAAALRRQA